MPAERPDHKFFQAKYYKTVSHIGSFHRAEEADIQLDYFEKLTTEPETYYLAKKPCTLCFGKWPCIMKKGASKCRVCDGEACSFYDPKAVQTEPESSKSKTTSQKTDHKKPKATKPSSSKATSSKRQLSELSELSELSYVDTSPVNPQKKKMSENELATAREVVVIDVEDEESDEEQISHKTDHEKTKLTKLSSSRTTSSKRQLPESLKFLDLNSSPVKPQKKSRIESAPVRKEVVDDDQDEESDEEKYEHNSRTCRRLLDKLESQKWYKRLEGKGHCLRDLVEMEKLHWKSINGPKGRRFVEVE
jgi:hypothetical protein